MDARKGDEDDNVGENDCYDAVEDVDGAMYAEASGLFYGSGIADNGGQLYDGVVDLECVTDVDG